jgi:glutamate dehydrogenase (NAD(P)+)
MPRERKEALIRAFAHALRYESDYIFGPDMGTDETCMAWIKDEIGRAVGLPAALGGLPLDELGATAWGLLHCAEAAVAHAGITLKGARIAVQGFGAVGRHAARFLAGRGARLVAASDSTGTVVDPRGLDVEALARLKDGGGALRDHPKGEKLDCDGVIGVECDIWIPAARPDVLNADNVSRLRAKLVLQGANIPFTLDAERTLAARGVIVVPDFIANAGGVICAAMEYRGATRTAAFEAIAERVRGNTERILGDAKSGGILPRQAADALAEARVREAMRYRRFAIL